MNFSRGLTLLLLTFLLFISLYLDAQNRAIDSILRNDQPDTLKLDALLDRGFDHAVKGETSAITYVNAVYHLIGARVTPAYLNLKSQANNALGTYYIFTGKYDKAEEAYSRNLAIGKEMSSDAVIAKTYGNLGNLANNKGDYKTAVNYLLLTLKYAEKNSDLSIRYYSLSNLANSYIRLKQYDKAISSLKAAIPFAVKNKDKRFEANLYNSLATAYDDAGHPDAGISGHLRAYSLSKEISNDKGIGSAALNLGTSYNQKKQYKLAEKYIKEAIISARRIGDVQNLAEAFHVFAKNKTNIGIYKDALRYADSAVKYNEMAKDRHLSAVIYADKASILAKTENFKAAYANLERSRRLNDSVLNTSITAQVAEMETKYETEKKERENQQLTYDNKIKTLEKEEAERSRNHTFAASLAAILLSMLSFIAFYRYKSIRTRYDQEQELLRALFEGEQKERIRIARDLHDSIGQLLSVVKMNFSSLYIRLGPDEQLSKTEAIVDTTINEVRSISHNLIPEELHFGLFAAIEDLCEKIGQSGTTVVKTNIIPEAREHQFERSSELSIYRVIQEVLSNMVRHAQATHILLEIQLSAQQITISIRDNGRGFDTSSIKDSTGIGWKNIAARVNMLGGELQVRSESLIGTQIEISLPGL